MAEMALVLPLWLGGSGTQRSGCRAVRAAGGPRFGLPVAQSYRIRCPGVLVGKKHKAPPGTHRGPSFRIPLEGAERAAHPTCASFGF